MSVILGIKHVFIPNIGFPQVGDSSDINEGHPLVQSKGRYQMVSFVGAAWTDTLE